MSQMQKPGQPQQNQNRNPDQAAKQPQDKQAQDKQAQSGTNPQDSQKQPQSGNSPDNNSDKRTASGGSMQADQGQKAGQKSGMAGEPVDTDKDDAGSGSQKASGKDEDKKARQ